MTSTTRDKIPTHLRKYIVSQDYARYTTEDQAVWRFILRQLRDFLSRHAHPVYLEGLKKTGITVDRIPSIDQIDEHLEHLDWGAVPVSGFIPPAAFMEFQSLGILPIASDMRTLDHIGYTPAPDIVHEAAGHAPILADPNYSAYLRLYGDVARNAILSREDLKQYEAIRLLSDIKEDPRSTAQDIQKAERELEEINASIKNISEAALLSRMNWWTAEYGLVGKLSSPRIFGAGLLSSVGESRHCLEGGVRKIPLSVDCVQVAYDITEPQPQLFVAEDFAHLGDVLDQLAEQMAFRIGGVEGLQKAVTAGTVNSVELDTGIQISGVIKAFLVDDEGSPAYLQFEGPSQLSYERRELNGQGRSRHAHGYSTPVGPLKNSDLEQLAKNARVGHELDLQYQSGVHVQGRVSATLHRDGRLIMVTLQNCRVLRGSQVLFDPSWGEYDMAIGESVRKVFGGAADREAYGDSEDFVAARVPMKDYTPQQQTLHTLFARIRDLRERSRAEAENREIFNSLLTSYFNDAPSTWLPGVELLELSHHLKMNDESRRPLIQKLQDIQSANDRLAEEIADGIRLAGVE
ncbi:MAG: aromatic amino acid hydroxylase [Bdellovibrionales bacterium]